MHGNIVSPARNRSISFIRDNLSRIMERLICLIHFIIYLLTQNSPAPRGGVVLKSDSSRCQVERLVSVSFSAKDDGRPGQLTMVKLTYNFITINRIVIAAMNSMRLSIMPPFTRPTIWHRCISATQRLFGLPSLIFSRSPIIFNANAKLSGRRNG